MITGGKVRECATHFNVFWNCPNHAHPPVAPPLLNQDQGLLGPPQVPAGNFELLEPVVIDVVSTCFKQGTDA